MKKLLVMIIAPFFLSGCAGMMPAEKDVKKTFTYDYQVESVNQEDLWVRARDYFAETYGDSRSVLRVQDREEATLIGRGAATWYLATNRCSTEYHVRFQSKDEKARLQLELIEGVPSYSSCSGWPWPSKDGYQTIVTDFDALSAGLEKALNETSSFSDF